MRKHHRYKNLLSALLLPGILSVLYAGIPVLAEEPGQVESAEATVMQLMKTEGTVDVSNTSGRSISLIPSMKLHNGYHAETQEASYAWINLDSEKLTKLDAVSEAEVRKSGKKLELLLESGSLFFNVKEDLQEDETLNVRTSTMVMGVRGTSGWVKSVDKWQTQVYILEGKVQCHVTDPVTGQAKNITLTSGESAEFYAYPQEQEGDKCDIITKKFTEDDIDGFALVELVQDAALCEEIEEASGLEILSLSDTAQQRLEESEAGMRQIMAEIREKEAGQEHHISKDPVWKGSSPSDGSGDGRISSWLNPGSSVTESSGVNHAPAGSEETGSEEAGSHAESTVVSGNNSKKDDSGRKPGTNSGWLNRPGTGNEKPDDVNEKARQAYQKVLDKYIEVSKIKYSDYLSDPPTYGLEPQEYVSPPIMYEYFLGNTQGLYYTFHDINGDGTDELIVALESGKEIRGAAVYTYYAAGEAAHPVFLSEAANQSFFCVMTDGTILVDGCMGEVISYKISQDGWSQGQESRYAYEGEAYLLNKVNAYKNENGLTEIDYDWISLDVQQNERYVNPFLRMNQEKREKVEAVLREVFLEKQRFEERDFTDEQGVLHQLSTSDTSYSNLRIYSNETRESKSTNELMIPFTVDVASSTLTYQNAAGYFIIREFDDMEKSFQLEFSGLFPNRQPGVRHYYANGKYIYVSSEARYISCNDLLPYMDETTYISEAGNIFDIWAVSEQGCIMNTPDLSNSGYGIPFTLHSQDVCWTAERKDTGEICLFLYPQSEDEIVVQSAGTGTGVEYLAGTYHKQP